MPETTVQAPGTFCWLDLGTTDHEGAKRFYRALFGWDLEDVPGGPGTYTMIRLGEKEIGGMHGMAPEQLAQGAPPNWMSYVAVENADAAAKKAASLGGSVIMPGYDVMDVGRMAILQDPVGATFAVWQAKQHPGAGMACGPGTPCWHEHVTRDTKVAGAFYQGLFGWNLQERPMGSMTYTMFMLGEMSAGGMMPMMPEYGDAPSHWMVYFQVEDIDASIRKAKSAGANVIVPRMEIADVGSFSLIADPQGAHLSIIQLQDA